jgi:hypothetical protein
MAENEVNWMRIEKNFGVWEFWDLVQRRGGRVSPLKIGSRDGEMCFGGICWIYADLRREFIWGNLVLVFFEIMGDDPRGGWEEGGH